MVKQTVAVTALSALALFSCQKEIAYKGDQGESLLVVNSITEGDSVFKVKLEHSRFFLESSNGNFSITTNAVVQLQDLTTSQVFTSSVPDAQGNYVFPVASVPGHGYAIQVTHPDYTTVYSSTLMPVAVPIQSVDTSSYQTSQGTYMKANVAWNDPSGEDFYVLKLAVVNTTQGWSYELPLASYDLNLDELSSSELAGEENYSPQLFFTDELYDGTQKILEVRFQKMAFNPDEHYKFKLYRCNKDTYKYLVSSLKAKNAANDFFSEPVKVFTNIENGYGIFGGLTQSVFVQ